MSIARALAVSFFLLVAGCGAHAGAGAGGGANGGASANDDAGLCRDELFTEQTCFDSQIGLSCPGTSQCACDGVPVTAKSSCTCQEQNGTATWVCDDSVCAARCSGGSGGSGGGGGSGGASPVSVCVSFIQAEYACVGQPPVSSDDALLQCTEMEQMCGSTFDAVMTCYAGSSLVCDQGLPELPGCTDEVNALAECAGVMTP